jgi:predicted nucleic acid-binding protein
MSCRFLLDTNVISEVNKPNPNPLVIELFWS